MWGEAGDLGIDQHMDSSDPETYTQRMAPSSLFRSFAPKKTSGDLMVSGKCGVLCGESIEDHIGTGMHWLHVSDAVEDISGQKKDADGGELAGGVLGPAGIL